MKLPCRGWGQGLGFLAAVQLPEWHLHDRFHGVYSQIGVCRRQRETSWSISRHGSRQRGAEPQREQMLDQGEALETRDALPSGQEATWDLEVESRVSLISSRVSQLD